MKSRAPRSASTEWLVFQIGAREHYTVARALHNAGLLRTLFTDAWAVPRGPISGLYSDRFRSRYDATLAKAQVVHFTAESVVRELRNRLLRHRSAWNAILQRNDWFQRRCVEYLKREGVAALAGSPPPSLFAYSYAARHIFQLARETGARSVLCQIDGGEADERLMRKVLARHAGVCPASPPPPRYWESWREECRLADTIVINSEWSRDLLISMGIHRSKLTVVPVLANCGDEPKVIAARTYPPTFSDNRPLRVLLLGTMSVRKGVIETLEAAKRMVESPIHFDFVGANTDGLSEMVRSARNATWHGAVPRTRTAHYYRDADVFLFPTHSDGFGLTQIEAQEQGLPVIASRHCGRVVVPGRTGLILEDVSGEAIQQALISCLARPHMLAEMSANCLTASRDHAAASEKRLLDILRSI